MENRDAYLFDDGPPYAAVHEARDAILLDNLVLSLDGVLGVAGGARRGIDGFLFQGDRGASRGRVGGGAGGRAVGGGIVLEELFAAGEALLEILVRSTALAGGRGGARSACDAGLCESAAVGWVEGRGRLRFGFRFCAVVGWWWDVTGGGRGWRGGLGEGRGGRTLRQLEHGVLRSHLIFRCWQRTQASTRGLLCGCDC